MAGKVTIQDIADALGLSRNTVSRAINHTGVLAEVTRERVLRKAAEMGYKQFSDVAPGSLGKEGQPLPDTPSSGAKNAGMCEGEHLSEKNRTRNLSCPQVFQGTIAIFTTIQMETAHFSARMLEKFQSELLQSGYGFAIYPVEKEEVKNLSLPHSFLLENTAGILCFEMFDRRYCDMLCGLEIPLLFVDAPASCCCDVPKADRLLMENRSGIHALVSEMAKRGKKRIGFIGEKDRCQSFRERYMAYREALLLGELPYEKDCCFTDQRDAAAASDQNYQIYLREKLRNLKSLPDIFLCVNDYTAFQTLKVFREMGISVPEDVYLCGFDDSPESSLVTPALTTVRIHGSVLGSSAVWLLLSRIKNPSLNYRTVYTETTLVFRESTGDVVI